MRKVKVFLFAVIAVIAVIGGAQPSSASCDGPKCDPYWSPGPIDCTESFFVNECIPACCQPGGPTQFCQKDCLDYIYEGCYCPPTQEIGECAAPCGDCGDCTCNGSQCPKCPDCSQSCGGGYLDDFCGQRCSQCMFTKSRSVAVGQCVSSTVLSKKECANLVDTCVVNCKPQN